MDNRWFVTTCLAWVVFLGVLPAHATSVAKAEMWAFCGADPVYDPLSEGKVQAFHDIGIDATFGPCLGPPPDYTAACPGYRYADPDRMAAVVDLNAKYNLKTIIYDARFWSDDASVRQAAIDFWWSRLAWIRAIDMGDEFTDGEWSYLVARWQNILSYVTPVTGVGPYTNHLGNPYYLEKALATLPLAGAHLSYDLYALDPSLELARSFSPRVSHLMCAISATDDFPGFINQPGPLTQALITEVMGQHRAAGCGSFLIFNAGDAYNPPLAGTKTINTHSSPVEITDFGWGVRDGSTYSSP